MANENEKKKRKRDLLDRFFHYIGLLIKAAILPLLLWGLCCGKGEPVKGFINLFTKDTGQIVCKACGGGVNIPRGISCPQSIALIVFILACALVLVILIRAVSDILRDD